MRLVMMGTGPFAVPTFRAIAASGHEVVAVVSRPPRGRRREPSPIEQAAAELGLDAWTPETVNCDESRSRLADLAPDLFVVCDYGEILKNATLEVPRLGGVNLHGSLLPRYRGAAPVQWAVLNGDKVTGNTVIQMTPGLDAGPIMGTQQIEIDPDETAEQLEARLSDAGAELVLRVLVEIESGTASGLPQDKALATKAPRLEKSHGLIDWGRTAVEIKNQVRALQPWPRAYTHWPREGGEPLRIILHRVDVGGGGGAPGTVLRADGVLEVAAAEGVVVPRVVQPSGKKAMPAEQFLRGYKLAVGDVLQ